MNDIFFFESHILSSFVSSTFEVETSFPGEKSKRIIFRSAADNQYCSIIEENIFDRYNKQIKRKKYLNELYKLINLELSNVNEELS